MKLTIKSIIRWEQLNKKSFSLLDYNNEEEILSLFYACALTGGIPQTFKQFKESLTEEDARAMVADFEQQAAIMAQFHPAPEPKARKGRGESAAAPAHIRDIAAALIMNGLDVNYVMNEMELCDLPTFSRAYEEKVKENLTSQRLWTFITLSPNLKKGAKPQDIYPFPWETDKAELSEAEMEQGRNEFQAFMQTGLKK